MFCIIVTKTLTTHTVSCIIQLVCRCTHKIIDLVGSLTACFKYDEKSDVWGNLKENLFFALK